MQDMDVLLLKVKNLNAPGLKPPTRGESFYMQQDNYNASLFWDNEPISRAPELLEGFFKMPIIDETGLKENFSIDLRWKELGERDPSHDALKKALLDQLGLELVPSRASLEMLVVEKVKN
jgi:uncharacterized protein (TIGR03435 family)